jgi:hypothetical protein
MVETRLPGSFRDPAGHVFLRDGIVHRRVDPPGIAAYRRLIDSGLYAALIAERLLIPHEELDAAVDRVDGAVVLRPQQIPMVSYPYEWSLSQLRDAAVATLRAQRIALRFDMVLKDASAFNVQFLDGRPVLIDTLSFDAYRGGPWIAYRQFCQHLYAPLAVAAACDARLVRLGELFIDGLPLSIASRLLPRASYLRPGPLFHIHLHAKAEHRWSAKAPVSPSRAKASIPDGGGSSTRALQALVESLERAVTSVAWRTQSAWADYYAESESYTSEGFAQKAQIVEAWIQRIAPARVWDVGANTGYFSKMAARRGAYVAAFDSDPACVETLYREVRDRQISGVLPLVLDLTNPSPPIGWGNAERMTLAARGPVDLLLALAVTHHLAIGNNVPFAAIADYFARLTRRAIVEFVPKADPMVQRMLSAREDIFGEYTESAFEMAFATRFAIDERVVSSSGRTLYLMTAR